MQAIHAHAMQAMHAMHRALSLHRVPFFHRHGRGDAYPLYTLDTLRNLADHLFDSSTGHRHGRTQCTTHTMHLPLGALLIWCTVCGTGYRSGPARAAAVRPCQLLYTTLRPTRDFVRQVHAHIRVPYLLLSDTADVSIAHGPDVDALLGERSQLRHWWAVDNEVLDSPKLEGLPLGVMDSLELGNKGQPRSVQFHANVTEYLRVLGASQRQRKSSWLMMQMTETHPERRRVRAHFAKGWGDGEVRLTAERAGKINVRSYLDMLGQHRFVLSPRGNGLDAHRTWEALLVGAIPIVRSTALNPLYDGLPVLVVNDWPDVTPALLREFYANHSHRAPLYQYEKLFADYWIGQVGVHRERCLADERARRAPRFVYDYHAPGGWVPLDGPLGARRPTPVWTGDAVKGG